MYRFMLNTEESSKSHIKTFQFTYVLYDSRTFAFSHKWYTNM